MAPRRALALVAAALLGVAALGPGCRSPAPLPPPRTDAGQPTVRLVLLANPAGALEPCGCTKEQLGGIDRLGALLERERQDARATVLLAAGAVLFPNTRPDPAGAVQQRWKAETIALALGDLGLAAWAPGGADFADGPVELARYAASAHAKLLACNLQRPSELGASIVHAGAVEVGVVGLSEPKLPDGQLPEGVSARPEGELAPAVTAELARLRAQGARLFVALAAMPRGAALRLAERVPELHVLAVAEPSGANELDDEQPSPTLIGPTLVVGAANHLQTAVVVDIYLGAPAFAGEPRAPTAAEGDVSTPAAEGEPIRLADTGGIAQAEQIAVLSRRIRQLETRVADWLAGGRAPPEELAARRAELEKLRRERSELERRVSAPSEADGVRYAVREIRDGAGSEPRVAARMQAYYRRVNEHNRVAFADRRPPPVGAGEASYVGQDACSTPECHQAARKFCDTTPHSRAYESLVKGLKQYNLECVGCHVTGYGRRGGSTVTFNEALRGVQCEECHGPGSLHVARPNDKGLVVLKTPPELCAERCHHPPHVTGFDPATKMELELGPGHGAR
jgi:hypothetical protein